MVTLRWGWLALAGFSLCLTGCLEPYCGDGYCDDGEESSCYLDCEDVTGYCGDGICTAAEMSSCTTDCRSDGYCGDGYCDAFTESEVSCPGDCIVTGYCGDGYCDASNGETPSSCSDCSVVGGYCGDGICESGESCTSDCQLSDCWSQSPPLVANRELFAPGNFMLQSCNQWCWASCGTMLAGYFGRFASQCTLMSFKSGFPDLNTCCSYAACTYQPCNSPAQPNEITNLIQYALGLHVQFTGSAISEAALINEIANNRPVEVGYQNSFAGHVVLVTGMQYVGAGQYTYTVMDPFNGIQQGVTYQQLLYGYMGSGLNWYWSMTWYQIAPVQDGCPL